MWADVDTMRDYLREMREEIRQEENDQFQRSEEQRKLAGGGGFLEDEDE
jgi:hypothetical protein